MNLSFVQLLAFGRLLKKSGLENKYSKFLF